MYYINFSKFDRLLQGRFFGKIKLCKKDFSGLLCLDLFKRLPGASSAYRGG